jgi:hypothetical protein
MNIAEKTDRELMVLKVELEQALYQIKMQTQQVDAEIMKRVKEEKEKNENTI